MKILLTICLALLCQLLLPPDYGRAMEIRFGTLSIIDQAILQRRLAPFVSFLEQSLGEPVRLQVGRNYDDTLKKLQQGELHIGFIGPAPYVTISDHVDIIAGLETDHNPYFRSVIVTRGDNSDINDLGDLRGKRFAFGSPRSTLAYFVPANMLLESGVADELAAHEFTHKHDRVAKHVIIGLADAGAMKESVFKKYSANLKLVEASPLYHDFVLVAAKKLGRERINTLRRALLAVDDPAVLRALNPMATGFLETTPAHYQPVREVIERVQQSGRFDH